MLMTSGTVAELLDGSLRGDATVLLSGAEVDSRLVREGDLFVALQGARSDGHAFVPRALETASAALVQEGVELPPPPQGRSHIVVDDPLAAYHQLAAHERTRRSWSVCAITGSVAKTTTKDFLVRLLESFQLVGGSQGNRNSTLGLPAQLLSQAEDCNVFVAEAGMSHPGELDLLGGILRPDLLLYTRITAAHTEFFDDISAVAEAKAELIPHLSDDGVLVLNDDDPLQKTFAARTTARVLRYGPRTDTRLDQLKNLGLLGSCGELVLADQRAPFKLPTPGLHQAENFLAAATAASALGGSCSTIADAASRLEAAPHRGRLLKLSDDINVVDDSYNASPAAVARALDLLRVSPGRRVAVLGEMYELGHTAEAAHREAGALAAETTDILLAVGKTHVDDLISAARAAGMASNRIHTATDADQATAALHHILEPGDVVLVKGSRGVALDRTVAALSEGRS